MNDCEAAAKKSNQVETIFSWAQKAGKGTGLVTNTRITHATPSGSYAHLSNRNFECDADQLRLKAFSPKCRDAATQLIYDSPGRSMDVIFGGGRRKFLPVSESEYGQRLDGKNLIDEWQNLHGNGVYVHNRTGLNELDVERNGPVLGLFAPSHMNYTMDADHELQPSLAEMTEKAIQLLQQHENGYFLFVEGGTIDLAHHQSYAAKALDETVEFAKAVQTAVDMTSGEDTLIVVTADHSHLMSMSGWSHRGNDILGLTHGERGFGINSIFRRMILSFFHVYFGLFLDNLPYTILSYANGPGFKQHLQKDGTRVDLTNIKFGKLFIRFSNSLIFCLFSLLD